MNRQYIMICTEEGLEILGKVFKTEAIQFLEVQGMNLNGQNNYNLLVTPVIPPLNPATIAPIPESPPATEVAPTEDANV